MVRLASRRSGHGAQVGAKTNNLQRTGARGKVQNNNTLDQSLTGHWPGRGHRAESEINSPPPAPAHKHLGARRDTPARKVEIPRKPTHTRESGRESGHRPRSRVGWPDGGDVVFGPASAIGQASHTAPGPVAPTGGGLAGRPGSSKACMARGPPMNRGPVWSKRADQQPPRPARRDRKPRISWQQRPPRLVSASRIRARAPALLAGRGSTGTTFNGRNLAVCWGGQQIRPRSRIFALGIEQTRHVHATAGAEPGGLDLAGDP